ncbi:MAG: hypothetical protein V3S69_02600 [Dehalococcoidales bacterium]
MIVSILDVVTREKEVYFPKLMSTVKGTVVLFESEKAFLQGRGTAIRILEEDKRRESVTVGVRSEGWSPDLFRDFNSSVTLTNTTEEL